MSFVIGSVALWVLLFMLLFPRIGKPLYGSDCCYFLLVAKIMRTEGSYPDILRNGIVDEYYRLPLDYPPAFAWLLSRFRASILERYNHALSFIMATGHGIIAALLVWMLSASYVKACFAALVCILVPNFYVNCLSLTTRLLASLCFSTSVTVGIYAHVYGYFWVHLLTLPIVSIVFLSHRRSLQGLFILNLLIGFLYRDIGFLVQLVGGFVFALIVSRELFIKVLKGHKTVLAYHWRRFRELRHDKKMASFADLGKRAFKTFASIFAANPVGWTLSLILVAKITGYAGNNNINSESLHGMLWTWLAIIIICSFLIDIVPWLKFIGWGTHYQIYSVIPTGVLAAYYMDTSWIFAGLIAFGFVIALLQDLRIMIYVAKGKGPLVDGSLIAVVEYLKNMGIRRVMCIPPYFSQLVAYLGNLKVMMGFSEHARIIAPNVYCGVDADEISRVVAEYDLEAIILQNADNSEEAECAKALYSPVYNNNKYTILLVQVPPPSGG